MATLVAIGAQWGDEGKGKIVDWLSPRADLVVRFQGGNNAGHTLVVDGEQTVLHVVPSGVLHAGTVNLIGPGVVVDPGVLIQELERLRERGVLRDPARVRVSGRAHVILDWNVALDKAREESRERGAIGTTGRGIGPTYEDKVARRGIRVADLLDPSSLAAQVERLAQEKNFELAEVHGWERVDAAQVLARAVAYGRALAPYVDHTGRLLARALREGKNVLFEGAQGTFLDVDHGTYPYVTSSNCVAGAACTGAGIGPTRIDRVLGISKAYTTRVGGGPFPTELADETGAHLAKRGNEFGSVTGRPRRCGWIDIPLLRRSVQLSGVDGLCITKLDVLDGLPGIRICTGYTVDGAPAELVPTGADAVARCVPVYETLPGWSASTVGARRMEDLPAAARAYLDRIETLSGVPIAMVSTGPDRDETILRHHPFH